MKQYLEYIEGKSSKFWEIELEGQFLNIQYGKIGTQGRTTRKDLKTAEKAYLALKKEILKKKSKGYIDPKHPVAQLALQDLEISDSSFKHNAEVQLVYYHNTEQLVLSATATHFYCWTTEGTLLTSHQFGKDEYFFGYFNVVEIPGSKQVVLHKQDLSHPDVFYIFDCNQDGFELVKEHSVAPPTEGYYRKIDVDEDYIYFGYTGGFMLLDHNFEVIKTLSSPQKHENSNGAIVSAASQLVAFVEYAGYGNKGDKVLVMDLEGNTISQFTASVHHSSYGMTAHFDSTGTILYTIDSNNYANNVQLWNVYEGKIVKEMVNYSSNGTVLSFTTSKDDQWMLIRPAGVDLILWNLQTKTVAWVKTNQDLFAHVTFATDKILYQSVGNRIIIISLEDGSIQQEIQGLSDKCQQLFYDNENHKLWAIGGKTAHCFNPDGSIHATLNITDFIAGKVAGKMLVKRRLGTYGGSYSWLDLATQEETPILSGHFRGIDYNDHQVITTPSYFSDKKYIQLWSHAGKQLKEIKSSKDVVCYLWQEKQFITTKGKTIELWTSGDKKPSFVIKNAHSREIEQVVVAADHHHFLSCAASEIKLWKGDTATPLLLEIVESPPIKIITKPFLKGYLIVTKQGAIYHLDPSTLLFQHLAQLSAPLTQATLTATGKLYVATAQIELAQIDLAPYLCLDAPEQLPAPTAATLDWTSLAEQPTETALLEFMATIPWNKLQEQDFLQLRSLLEQQATIGKAHEYFTQQLLEAGALLKHEFAHEEASGSFAMSPNGDYLAVGTWVGDDYEEDGTVQIWEIATGRCVNLLKENYGGIGWPYYYHMLQWSSNSKYLGAGLNTNCVAKLNPFSGAATPMATACITNGWSRPPAWSWQGDKDAFAISCWHNSEIPVGITSNKKLHSYEDDAKWMLPKLPAAIKEQLTREDLQPYSWCQTTQDGQFVYGYNRHHQVFGIDVEKRQVAWLKNTNSPVAFSTALEMMVYQENGQLILAEIRTGNPLTQYAYKKEASGLHFSSTGQLYAVYNEKNLTVYSLEGLLGQLDIKASIKVPYSADSELKPVQFSPSEDKLVILLDNGQAQIWDLKTLQPLVSFDITASGLYWGTNIVGVEEYSLSFHQEDGTLIRVCDKGLQVEAYNNLYDLPRPLETKKNDYGEYQELQPYYPLYKKKQPEWVAVLGTGLVISASGTLDTLDKHLSYTFGNKYAWPYHWGGTEHLYSTLYEAKDAPQLGLEEKDKKTIKDPNSKKKKAKKSGIDFTKGGDILDIIKVHQDSLSELHSGWNYHTSEHHGIVARKLITLGIQEQALTIALKSKEWYLLVANLGFVAIDLANQGALELAEKAFVQGIEALEAGEEEARNQWAATFVYAPLAAAAKLLGKESTSKEYFQLALQQIEEESNTFEKYAHLATAYLLCGEVDKALETLYNGPLDGGWFSSYQMDFLLLLLQQGHLDKALAYFNSSLESYGSIDEFDLLDAGMTALLEQKNYPQAIAWIEKFEGLSTDGVEAALINTLIQEQEVKFATKWLLQKLAAVKEYGNSSIKYIYFLSRINPKEAQQQLKQLPTGQTIYYLDRYYEYLGKIQSNLTAFKEVSSVLKSIQDQEHKLLYLMGLLHTLNLPNKKKQTILLNQAVDLLETLPTNSNSIIKHHIRLATIAHALKAKDHYKALSAQAKSLAKANKDLGFYGFNEFQNLYLELGLVEEAHALFQLQTPSNRKSGMRTYALALAKQGYLKTAAELLKTLPAKDLNDRPSAAIEIIKAL